MDENDREKIYLQIYRTTTVSLKKVTDEMDQLTPQRTDLYRSQLSALYALLTDELARLEQERAIQWLEVKKYHEGIERKKPLSDKAADAECDVLPSGQRRIELRFRLKALEKMISALSGRMYRLNQEAKNEY